MGGFRFEDQERIGMGGDGKKIWYENTEVKRRQRRKQRRLRKREVTF